MIGLEERLQGQAGQSPDPCPASALSPHPQPQPHPDQDLRGPEPRSLPVHRFWRCRRRGRGGGGGGSSLAPREVWGAQGSPVSAAPAPGLSRVPLAVARGGLCSSALDASLGFNPLKRFCAVGTDPHPPWASWAPAPWRSPWTASVSAQ